MCKVVKVRFCILSCSAIFSSKLIKFENDVDLVYADIIESMNLKDILCMHTHMHDFGLLFEFVL